MLTPIMVSSLKGAKLNYVRRLTMLVEELEVEVIELNLLPKEA